MKTKTLADNYGVMAEFNSAAGLMAAARKTREAGYVDVDAYSPFPVEGLAEEIGFNKTRLPLMVLIGGIIGGISGFGMCWYANVIAYPINSGGKPFNSWPAWIPITFEMTVLFASLTAVVGMILLNKLPMPYHPVFNVSRFASASRDQFFLCIESTDPKFDPVESRRFLQSLQPVEVNDVPW